MGVVKKNDGRYIVGANVTTANEYKGSLGWRDIFIQLTADGATAESIEKLEFMRDYAIYHSGKGNPVMPPSVAVWISNNGTTTAVEADDISYTDGVYTICGIKYENNAWDFSHAGEGSGGAGGGLPAYTDADADKGLFLKRGTETVVVAPEQTITTDEEVIINKGTTLLYAAELFGIPFTLENAPDSVVAVYEVNGGATQTQNCVKNLRGYAPEDMPDYTMVFYENSTGKWYFNGTGTATITLSVTAFVPSVAPAWTNALPSVTDADNGDVLTVVDGVWDKAAPSGGTLDIKGEDVGKALYATGTPTTVTVAEAQTFTVSNGYGTMSVDFSSVSVGDLLQASGSVLGVHIDIDMHVVEYDGKKYGVGVGQTDYNPSYGYISEDGEFFNPSLSDIPSASATVGIIATVYSDKAAVWNNPGIKYFTNSSDAFDGLSVKDAKTMLDNGIIPFTVNGDVKMLTSVNFSGSTYSVYFNFNLTALASNLSGSDRVPIIGGK